MISLGPFRFVADHELGLEYQVSLIPYSLHFILSFLRLSTFWQKAPIWIESGTKDACAAGLAN